MRCNTDAMRAYDITSMQTGHPERTMALRWKMPELADYQKELLYFRESMVDISLLYLCTSFSNLYEPPLFALSLWLSEIPFMSGKEWWRLTNHRQELSITEFLQDDLVVTYRSRKWWVGSSGC